MKCNNNPKFGPSYYSASQTKIREENYCEGRYKCQTTSLQTSFLQYGCIDIEKAIVIDYVQAAIKIIWLQMQCMAIVAL